MKLPTSSSVLLATLAISSSSSSLAAPAGDMHDSGLSQSPNKYTHHDSNMHPAHEHNSRPMHMKRRSESIVARINDDDHMFGELGDMLGLPMLKDLAVDNDDQAQSVQSAGLAAESVPTTAVAKVEADLLKAIEGVINSLTKNAASVQNIADDPSATPTNSASASMPSSSADPSAAAAAEDAAWSTFANSATSATPSSSATPVVAAAADGSPSVSVSSSVVPSSSATPVAAAADASGDPFSSVSATSASSSTTPSVAAAGNDASSSAPGTPSATPPAPPNTPNIPKPVSGALPDAPVPIPVPVPNTPAALPVGGQH